MKILIIDLNKTKNSIFRDEFVKPVEQILINNKFQFETIHFLEIENKKIEKFNKIILCGTALKDFFYLENIGKFNWIKNTNVPILGICAGAQIIGKIFGCEIEENKEIGIIEILKLKENILFEEDKLNVYSLHKKSLINLSKFDILAKSKNSIQFFKHKSKFIYGILSHPEVKNPKIIINFIKILKN